MLIQIFFNQIQNGSGPVSFYSMPVQPGGEFQDSDSHSKEFKSIVLKNHILD